MPEHINHPIVVQTTDRTFRSCHPDYLKSIRSQDALRIVGEWLQSGQTTFVDVERYCFSAIDGDTYLRLVILDVMSKCRHFHIVVEEANSPPWVLRAERYPRGLTDRDYDSELACVNKPSYPKARKLFKEVQQLVDRLMREVFVVTHDVELADALDKCTNDVIQVVRIVVLIRTPGNRRLLITVRSVLQDGDTLQ